MTTARSSTSRVSWDGITVNRNTKTKNRRRAFVAAAVLLAGGVQLHSPPAAAQAVRTAMDANERALERARDQLSRDPSDLRALREGVQAAMRLGRIDLAATYAQRAQQLAPGDAHITAARGAIEIHRGRPRQGLALFEQADMAGLPENVFVSDRALGYDLLGDQPSAQYYYAIANRLNPNDETLRRYALSLSIIGDYDTGAAMLKPLLNIGDRPAWRMQAFMLAINGRGDEAVEVLNRILPSDVAAELTPYLLQMPNLTRAQQAAAANLGIFPSLAQAGNSAAEAQRAKRRRPGD